MSEIPQNYDRLSLAVSLASNVLDLCANKLVECEEKQGTLSHREMESIKDGIFAAQELLAHGRGETFLIAPPAH